MFWRICKRIHHPFTFQGKSGMLLPPLDRFIRVGGEFMSKKLGFIILVVCLIFAVPLPAMAAPKVLYWISHGSPADPVWIYYLAGANQWAKDTGIEVRTSFHSGDVPSQQEAVRSAIAAKATAIVT